jgi:aldehyde dehydrogenase (NAD+)
VVARLRAAHRRDRMTPLSARRAQLAALRTMLTTRSTELAQALRQDLAKPEPEAMMTEIDYVVDEIDLDAWLAPSPVPAPDVQLLAGSSAWTSPEPLGVVLVIGPWNFPLHALLLPLVGALAAGNCAVLKPSELAPATGAVIARLVPQHLDGDVCAVVQGGAAETTDLLKERFDHAFFTAATPSAGS